MNSKTRKMPTKALTIVILLIVLICGYGGYRLYNHEVNQKNYIQELEDEVATLKAQQNATSVSWSDTGFNYLAIGNSITLHSYADYWWDDDRGMAASEDSKDYVHLVESYLISSGKDVTMHAKNMASWETNGSDRFEFLEQMDAYLSASLNLVTIQLGENAGDLTTWESDFEALISYVKTRCPNAQIIVIGDFWDGGDRDALKEAAAKAQGVDYVSLDGIKENEEYFAGLGTTVTGKNGELHTIEHEGVARHPGDKGMAAIAERIEPVINLS